MQTGGSFPHEWSFQCPHASAGCRGHRGQQNHHGPFMGAPVSDGKMQPGAVCSWLKVMLLTAITVRRPDRFSRISKCSTDTVSLGGPVSILSRPGSAPSRGTYQLRATWGQCLHMGCAAMLAEGAGKTQRLWPGHGRGLQRTGDVWPAWLWLEEGRPCPALSRGAHGASTAPRQTPADAHGLWGIRVRQDRCVARSAPQRAQSSCRMLQQKQSLFDLDNSQRGGHYCQCSTDENVEAGEVSNLPNVKQPVSGRARIRLRVRLESSG